jgi:capsular polysaccharide biosynthesis protein
MVLVSLFIGIFGALGIPFILEFLDHRIKTSDEVQTFLSLPVICTLPEVKGSALRKGEMSNG